MLIKNEDQCSDEKVINKDNKPLVFSPEKFYNVSTEK